MSTYCIAQELYSVLCADLDEKEPQKEEIYVNAWLTHCAVQQRRMQHCKLTRLQEKLAVKVLIEKLRIFILISNLKKFSNFKVCFVLGCDVSNVVTVSGGQQVLSRTSTCIRSPPTPPIQAAREHCAEFPVPHSRSLLPPPPPPACPRVFSPILPELSLLLLRT